MVNAAVTPEGRLEVMNVRDAAVPEDRVAVMDEEGLVLP